MVPAGRDRVRAVRKCPPARIFIISSQFSASSSRLGFLMKRRIIVPTSLSSTACTGWNTVAHFQLPHATQDIRPRQRHHLQPAARARAYALMVKSGVSDPAP